VGHTLAHHIPRCLFPELDHDPGHSLVVQDQDHASDPDHDCVPDSDHNPDRELDCDPDRISDPDHDFWPDRDLDCKLLRPTFRSIALITSSPSEGRGATVAHRR